MDRLGLQPVSRWFLPIVVALLALSVAPNAAADHGWPQHFSTRTIIVRTELGFGPRVLQRALDSWAPVGITFDLHDVGLKDWCSPSDVTTVASDKIRLCRSEYLPWATVNQVIDGHHTAGLIGVHPNYSVDKSYLHYLFCHEIGHTLGLDHDFDEPGSCMSHTAWPTPSAHDIETLQQAYAHTD